MQCNLKTKLRLTHMRDILYQLEKFNKSYLSGWLRDSRWLGRRDGFADGSRCRLCSRVCRSCVRTRTALSRRQQHGSGEPQSEYRREHASFRDGASVDFARPLLHVGNARTDELSRLQYLSCSGTGWIFLTPMISLLLDVWQSFNGLSFIRISLLNCQVRSEYA